MSGQLHLVEMGDPNTKFSMFAIDNELSYLEWVAACNIAVSNGNELPKRGINVEKPVLSHLLMRIDRAFSFGGTVRITIMLPELNFTKSLNMDSLVGKFRLVASFNSTNSKDSIFEWWEPGDASYRGLERFGDDDWDARTVCTDVQIAKEMFTDLFNHGNLTEVSMCQIRSAWNPKPR